MQKADFTDSGVTDIILVTSQLMYHSVFDIFKMASRLVADKFDKPMGAAPYL